MKKIAVTVLGVFLLFSCQTNAQEEKTDDGAEKVEKKVIPAASFATEADATVVENELDEKKKSKAISMNSIYGFKVTDINGKEFDFEKLRGKKILVVNTASNCGYTPQYKELEELYKKVGSDKLVIVGFPSNDFGGQEPGTNEQIKTFCTKNFEVSFPMMSKISVKGKEMEPIYQFLTQKSQNGLKDSTVDWNFQKYLINEKGNLVAVFPSKTTPLSLEIMSAIQK